MPVWSSHRFELRFWVEAHEPRRVPLLDMHQREIQAGELRGPNCQLCGCG